jgi:hypothetical protein
MSKFHKILVILIIVLAIEFLMIYIGYKTNLKTNSPGQTDMYNKESYIVLTHVTNNF